MLLALTVLALIVSGIRPHDRLTWWLEAAPVLLAIPFLLATGRRFPLTPLAYRMIFLHALVLLLGAQYTYARVPIGEWLREAFDLCRNPYDRIGHLAQGFFPAIVAREVLLRKTPLRRGGWLFTLTTAVCLAISSSFELFEWLAATILHQSADAYLATQGDPWDTQWDMLCALVGTTAAQLALLRLHDRQLGSRLEPASGGP